MFRLKCPICKEAYSSNGDKRKVKQALYNHIKKEHSEYLKGLSPANLYFNLRNKKTHGNCIVCGNKTTFNEKSEKYNRICSDKCATKYREQFKERMVKVYGKEHLLDDMEKQREMLANRKISGKYNWDGKEFVYTGSYELKFLEFMHKIYKWDKKDIMMPAPIDIKYFDVVSKRERVFIPDCYIPSLDLIVEIKGSYSEVSGNKNANSHEWRKREYAKEVEKIKALHLSKRNFIQIEDNDFSRFTEYVENMNTVMEATDYK